MSQSWPGLMASSYPFLTFYGLLLSSSLCSCCSLGLECLSSSLSVGSVLPSFVQGWLLLTLAAYIAYWTPD